MCGINSTSPLTFKKLSTLPTTLGVSNIPNTTNKLGNSWNIINVDIIKDEDGNVPFTVMNNYNNLTSTATIKLVKSADATETELGQNILYRIYDSATGMSEWTEYIFDDTTLKVPVRPGFIQFKNASTNFSLNENNYISFNVTNKTNVTLLGNIASLVNYSSTLNTYAFYKLFENQTYVTDIQNLYCSSTKFKTRAMQLMFSKSGVTTCMGIDIKELIGDRALFQMYSGCTKLNHDFNDTLTETPFKLSALTLTESCYANLFDGCTSLITIPELPATNLAIKCYRYMFNGCSGLTDLSNHILPATALTEGSYNYMFNNCSKLTKAPKILATTLANNCFEFMFNNCKVLNEIIVSFNNWGYIPATEETAEQFAYTSGWLTGNNNATTNKFICPNELKNTLQVRNVSTVPSNWIIDTLSVNLEK